MKKVLVDTNILVNMIYQGEDDLKLFALAENKKVKIFLTGFSIHTANYICRKIIGKQKLEEYLAQLLTFCHIAKESNESLAQTFNSAWRDKEDAAIYFPALENNIDAIISLNKKDFKRAKIPVLNSTEYLATLIADKK